MEHLAAHQSPGLWLSQKELCAEIPCASWLCRERALSPLVSEAQLRYPSGVGGILF